jgi:exopolysaccharide biosynthesis polyprenyl glycosylphosphotransferase
LYPAPTVPAYPALESTRDTGCLSLNHPDETVDTSRGDEYPSFIGRGDPSWSDGLIRRGRGRDAARLLAQYDCGRYRPCFSCASSRRTLRSFGEFVDVPTRNVELEASEMEFELPAVSPALPTLRTSPERYRGTGLFSWPRRALAVDASVLAIVAALLAQPFFGPHAPVSVWTIVFSLAVVGFLYARGMYSTPPDLDLIDVSRAVVIATLLATAVTVSANVAITGSSFLGRESLRSLAVAAVLLVSGRMILTIRERRIGRPTLIVGAGHVGRLVAKRLLDHPAMGLRPIGFLDKEPLEDDRRGARLPVLGASWDLERVVEQYGIEQVVVAFSTAPTQVLIALVERCEKLGVHVSLVPRLYERSAGRLTVARVGGLSLVSSSSPDPKGWQFAVKYAIDRVCALVLIVLLAPLFFLLSVGVLLSLGRPILYRQQRVGRDGKRFDMLKFRSMLPDLAQDRETIILPLDTAPGGVEGSDRRTRFGTFLRRWSLDELPQLINVLKGEMSFIGPRPERPEFVDQFEQSVHRYTKRHRVKSGITGWAQVNGLRGKTSLTDRVEWDNFYIENWSLWLDAKIALLTIAAVLRPDAVE